MIPDSLRVIKKNSLQQWANKYKYLLWCGLARWQAEKSPPWRGSCSSHWPRRRQSWRLGGFCPQKLLMSLVTLCHSPGPGNSLSSFHVPLLAFNLIPNVSSSARTLSMVGWCLLWVLPSAPPFWTGCWWLYSAWGWRLGTWPRRQEPPSPHHQHPTSQGIYNILLPLGFCFLSEKGYTTGQSDSADQVWSGCQP